VDILEEFTVRADPHEWQDALVRLTPRQYSISSSRWSARTSAG
jgi:sulfite reductase alpha subunit-like flavoprotein